MLAASEYMISSRITRPPPNGRTLPLAFSLRRRALLFVTLSASSPLRFSIVVAMMSLMSALANAIYFSCYSLKPCPHLHAFPMRIRWWSADLWPFLRSLGRSVLPRGCLPLWPSPSKLAVLRLGDVLLPGILVPVPGSSPTTPGVAGAVVRADKRFRGRQQGLTAGVQPSWLLPHRSADASPR